MWFFRKNINDALKNLESLRNRDIKGGGQTAENTAIRKKKIDDACKIVFEHASTHGIHVQNAEQMAAIADQIVRKINMACTSSTYAYFEGYVVECVSYLLTFEEDMKKYLSEAKAVIDYPEVSELIDAAISYDVKIFSGLRKELKYMLELIREKKYDWEHMKMKLSFIKEGLVKEFSYEMEFIKIVQTEVGKYFTFLKIANGNLIRINEMNFRALGKEGDAAIEALRECKACIDRFEGALDTYLNSQNIMLRKDKQRMQSLG